MLILYNNILLQYLSDNDNSGLVEYRTFFCIYLIICQKPLIKVFFILIHTMKIIKTQSYDLSMANLVINSIYLLCQCFRCVYLKTIFKIFNQRVSGAEPCLSIFRRFEMTYYLTLTL